MILHYTYCCYFHLFVYHAPVKAVREAVITTLIEWHDKFVSVLYVNDESSVTTFHITPLYIPNGFSPVETPDENSGFYYAQFSDSHNNWFDILVIPIENTQETFLDNEFSTYYSINCNGIQAIWGIMSDGSNTLLWERGTLSFQVCGNLDLTELIKISEKIGLNNFLVTFCSSIPNTSTRGSRKGVKYMKRNFVLHSSHF